ncbi:hypothetical protein BRPE64_ACDS04680 [Caballeronia insecticola]|uniref:Uncharacterized protein n=1 Tax=Caballeronia insecticola TaxID=758793 RepID=R4WWD2_9BURK|nr:hypothetical protein BRPE64_ACDS04680 [Caballeronia insecticola]
MIFEYDGPRQRGSGATIIGTKTYGVLTRLSFGPVSANSTICAELANT